MTKCEECGRYFYGPKCGCQLYWVCWPEIQGTSFSEWRDQTEEDAARSYVEHHDCGEDSCIGYSAMVFVRNASGDVSAYSVSAEYDIIYTVREKK